MDVEMGFGIAALEPGWLNEFDRFEVGLLEFDESEKSEKLEEEFGRPQVKQYHEMFFILSMFWEVRFKQAA